MRLKGEQAMKTIVTKPLKNWEKYEDGLLDIQIQNKNLKRIQTVIKPSKSYIKVLKK